MMISRIRLTACLCLIIALGTMTSPRAQAIKLFRGLPTADEVNRHGVRTPQLNSYNFRGRKLSCELPDGTQVNIALVDDQANFSFLAIRTFTGPTILANQRNLANRSVEYSIFSFYRECGVHAVFDVKATGPDDKEISDSRIVKFAECLAVIPTQQSLGPSTPLSYSAVARELQDEYDKRSSSSTFELKRCSNFEHVQKLSKNFSFPKRKY